MMLQLPIWRYPAVVIFSLALHGILLLIIFSEYRRNPPPSQIEWFDLKEMPLTPSEIQKNLNRLRQFLLFQKYRKRSLRKKEKLSSKQKRKNCQP